MKVIHNSEKVQIDGKKEFIYEQLVERIGKPTTIKYFSNSGVEGIWCREDGINKYAPKQVDYAVVLNVIDVSHGCPEEMAIVQFYSIPK